MLVPEPPPRLDSSLFDLPLPVLPGDAPVTIEEDASPFTRTLAKRFGVGIERCTLGQSSFKLGHTIFLDFLQTAERQNWAFCHELAHILLRHDAGTLPGVEEEMMANEVAAELLLPRDTFALDARMLSSLHDLKSSYPHASWEAILRRRLQFRAGIGTILDEGHMTFRGASPGFSCPPNPLPEEWETAKTAFNTATSMQVESGGWTVEAAYVDSGRGIRRILLWAERLDWEQSDQW